MEIFNSLYDDAYTVLSTPENSSNSNPFRRHILALIYGNGFDNYDHYC